MATCRLKANTYQVPLQAKPGTGSETFRAELSWVQPRGTPGVSWGALPAQKFAPGALGPGTGVPSRASRLPSALSQNSPFQTHMCKQINKANEEEAREAGAELPAGERGAGAAGPASSPAPHPAPHPPRPESAPAGSPPSRLPRTPARTPRTAGGVAARQDTPGTGNGGDSEAPAALLPLAPVTLGPSAHGQVNPTLIAVVGRLVGPQLYGLRRLMAA